MNRNRKLKKAVASTTAVVLSACMVAAPALTVDSAAPEKEETVYVNMDASGNVEKITVSDWLKNAAGSAELSDSSSLSDIKNVKGDETFTQDGEKLTWQADGLPDIYIKKERFPLFFWCCTSLQSEQAQTPQCMHSKNNSCRGSRPAFFSISDYGVMTVPEYFYI